MSLNSPIIKEGAFLLSDAHYSPHRPQLLDFLKAIKSNELRATQLILMGDIFDALFGFIKPTLKENKEVIDLINDISLNIEVIYLEGNHDFNLKSIFKNVRLYTIQEQPLKCSINDNTIYIAHGDFVGSSVYKLYTYFARSKVVLFLLNILNIIE